MPTAIETMELAEISQRLSFLDTERRKDRELIATLLERLEAQTGKLEAQSRQIQGLEGLLASARVELARFTQVERAMEQLRQEVALLLEANEEKRDKAYRELSRLRQVEQETMARQLGEVRKGLETVPRHGEELESLRVESSRLQGAITSLQHQLAELDKRSEDRVQSVIYLEEQRRQDTRRLTQVESEALALHKQGDSLGDKLSLLEQAVQVKNQKIDEAADLLEQQAQVIESQRVVEFRRQQQVAEWGKLVEGLKKEAADMAAQVARMHGQHDMVRRALADLELFRERLEKRQNEMSEMQRLAEDRQKRAMEEWQAEREKERKLFQVENDERWRENARFSDRRDARLRAGEEYMQMLASQVEALWDVQEAWAESVMVSSREWMATWGEHLKQRPSMPEPLKLPPIAPKQAPKIRPLPSAQATQEEQEEA
jgi:chromosome segregation ATPase